MPPGLGFLLSADPPGPSECSGAKFQKLAARSKAENSLEKYQPFIVQSRNFP